MKKTTTFLNAARRHFLFVICFLLFHSSFAQVPENTRLENSQLSKVQRWQEATFSVEVHTYAALTGWTLEATITPAGFIIDAPIQAVNQPAGSKITYYFKVTATCLPPQNGNEVVFRLSKVGEPVPPSERRDFSIADADFIFNAPANYQANFAHATKTHERVWAVSQSGADANVTHLRVKKSVSGNANLEIVKAELVSDWAGTPMGYQLTGSEFTQAGNTYTYLFDENIFAEYGFTNNKMNRNDTVFIKETFLMKTCTLAQSSYVVEYGNGTEWCQDPVTHNNPPKTEASIKYITFATGSGVNHGVNHDIATPEVISIGGGKGKVLGVYSIFNLRTDVTLKDVEIFFSASSARMMIKRAYIASDEFGTPFPGLPDIIFSDHPNAVGNPLHSAIYFTNFTDPIYASYGLVDFEGNGVYSNIPPSFNFRVALEIEVDLTKTTSCAATLLNDAISATFRFKDNCNNFATAGNTPNPGRFNISNLGYTQPANSKLSSENVLPGTPVTLSFSQNRSPNDAYDTQWALDVSKNDHYINVTLPEGFDYDHTKQGFRIKGQLPTDPWVSVPLNAVSKATNASGRVVLSVHNQVVNHQTYTVNYAYTMNYEIDIFFDPSYAIPCDEGALEKKYSIEHEFAFKGETQRFKYACYKDIPLNYMVVDPNRSVELDFDVQRMTFGWVSYEKSELKAGAAAERITLDNIHLHPGVERGVAGPYDNVDFITTISLKSDTTHNGDPIDDTFQWFLETGYNAPKTSPLGGCFMFPDPNKAVKVEVMGKGEFWLPRSAVDSTRSGNRYTFKIDLTPYTLKGDMEFGDVVKVTFKMRTNDNMPTVLTPVGNMTTTTWFDPPIDECGEFSSMKAFSVVDYATKDLRGINGAQISYYSENMIFGTSGTRPNGLNTAWVPGQIPFSSTTIFPNEFRPNQYVTRFEIEFNCPWEILGITFQENVINNINNINNMITTSLLLPSPYIAVTHTNEKTTVVATKELQACAITSYLFMWHIIGAPYCADNDTRATRKVTYLFYPSSEKDDVIWNASTYTEVYEGKTKYNPSLQTLNANAEMVANSTSWKFSLHNKAISYRVVNSDWNHLYWATDIELPYSWLSVTVPPNVSLSSLSLTDGTDTWTNFVEYGSGGGKYWVKLGSLNVPDATPRNFTLSCMSNSCAPFEAQLTFSQSRIDYPTNPEAGFLFPNPPCPNKTHLTLKAAPPPSMVQGVTRSPAGYITFCEEHSYSATFFSTQPNKLTDPVLIMQLCKGLELPLGTVSAIQNGVPLQVCVNDPKPDAGEWRTVTVTFPAGTVLEKYGSPGDTIRVDFKLKPTCNFKNGHVVETRYEAKTLCGNTIHEVKYSNPLRIAGITLNTEFELRNPVITLNPALAGIDITGTPASINIEVQVVLISGANSNHNDNFSLSLPPNMEITSATYTTDDGSGSLTFTLWDVDNNIYSYKARIPDLAFVGPQSADFTITLTPVNPYLWSCYPVSISMITGVPYELECPHGIPCLIEVETSNKIEEIFAVLKHDVNFIAGTINASGVYHTSGSEMVSFSGKISVPELADIEDLVIEVFSDASGSMVPVPGVSITIPHVTTVAGVTQFTIPTFTGEIPAADMCRLWLVIRRTETQNQYLCDSVAIRVPTPAYTLAENEFTTCNGKDLVIGDYAITGYGYSWSPDSYITTTPKTTTPVTVHFPHTFTGNQVMSLTVNRGGCTVGTAATVTVKETPAISTLTDVLCAGSTINHMDYVVSDAGNIVRFYTTNDCSGTPLAATGDILTAGYYTYYAQAELAGCFSDCEEIMLTVLPATVITAQPSATPQHVCDGTATFPTLSVTATGDGLSYEWFRNTTATTTGGTSVGTGASHTPSTTGLTIGTPYYYYVVVTGTCGVVTSSVSGAHTVNNATITQPNPANDAICSGHTKTFTLGAASGGTGNITYLWQQSSDGGTNWSPADGTNSGQNYTTPALTTPFSYRRVATGAVCGTHTTAAAAITIIPVTAISVQPSTDPQQVCTGTATFPTLSVTATGAGLSYEWFRNTTATTAGGTSVGIGASHTPSTAGLTIGTPYYYYVVVTGTCGVVTSGVSGAHTVTAKTVPTFSFPDNITYCFGDTPVTLPLISNNGIAGTWNVSPIDMTTAGTTSYTFTPDPGECAESKTIHVTVFVRATATDILVADEEICYAEPVTLHAKSGKGGFVPTFRWYSSQTSNTILHTGPSFPAGTFTVSTSFYVSGSDALHCENIEGDRREVKINVIICKLIDCGDVLTNKVAEEDEYLAKKYTHFGNGWDADIIWHETLDHIEYIVNGELLPMPTLDGFEFPLGLSTVKIKAYYMDIEDECEFTVFVERVCPPTISDDEGNEYKVTKLAGLCWTDNLKATKYAINLGEGAIPFAQPYHSTLYPNAGNYNFDTFGLLYDWHSALGETAGDTPAQGICPEFWHIPSVEEWNRLNAYPAEDLKSKQFWFISGNDKYGFDSRPAGLYNGAIGRYENLYGFTGWWSSSEPGTLSSSAHYFSFSYYCSHILKEVMQKGNGLSVRCVMDWED